MDRRKLMSALVGLMLPKSVVFAQVERAAQLNISPITPTLGAVGDATICTVNNFGGVAAAGQIRLKSWSQADGQDVLTDTADVGASPAFMTVDPGGRQVVRLVNLAAAPGATELSFRLLFNQVPMGAMFSGAGVHILMALSLPLFIPAAHGSPPELQAGFVQGPRSVLLRFTNNGDTHARLVDLVCRDAAGGQVFGVKGLAGYVLARSVRDIKTNLRSLPALGGSVTVQTQLSQTPIVVSLVGGL